MTNSDILKSEIENERSALAETLSSLINDFKPAALMEGWDTNGSEMAQKVVTAAKENPLAVGAIGAGIAWLAYTSSKPKATPAASDVAFNVNGEPEPQTARMDQIKKTAAQMRDTLYDGTAELSDVARARIVAARTKALNLQMQIESAAKAAPHAATDAMQKNPLAVCAGLAVAGAAVALSLPRSQAENVAFGATRDSLAAQAEDIFREEVARAKLQGREALGAAEQAFKSTMEDVNAAPKTH